jgi:hypothetical protein
METKEGRETPHIFTVRTRSFSVGLSRRHSLRFRLDLRQSLGEIGGNRISVALSGCRFGFFSSTAETWH